MSPMNPTGRVVYVCDEVLQDPTSGKISYLGIFDDVVSDAVGFPFVLNRLCVAAQLVGGAGTVPVRVVIVEGTTQTPIRTSGVFPISFPTRQQVVTVCIRLLDLVFPAPGTYFVELTSQGQFLDDRVLRVH